MSEMKTNRDTYQRVEKEITGEEEDYLSELQAGQD